MTAHRYWRLNNMQSAAGSFTQLCEFYLRETYGGANKIPTASSDLNHYNGLTTAAASYDGDSSTFYMQYFGDGNPNLWVAYDYGVGISPVEMYLKASTGDTVSRTMTTCTLQYSDTGLGGPWTDFKLTGFGSAWTVDGQVQAQDLFAKTPNINTTKGTILAPIHIPATNINTTKGLVAAVQRSNGFINVTGGKLLAVAQGRIAQPSLVAWTFTLDGHDFYALRLGDDTTLIYDQNTQQWAEWGEDIALTAGGIDTQGRWTLSTGLNWQGIGALANVMGSDIIAGDDTFGALYAFDPGFDEDYKPQTKTPTSFHRVAQGQLVMAGRDYVPIWGVRLTGSVGEQWTGLLVNVELQSSDDMGNSYFSNGIKIIPQNSYGFRLDWNSLGAMNAPGRIFKIIDDGAMVRIDALEAYDRDNPN